MSPRRRKRPRLNIFVFLAILLVTCSASFILQVANDEVVDRTSFLARGYARELYDRGRLLADKGNYELARQQYSCVTEIDPRNVDAHYFDGVARALQGDVLGAAASYNRVLSIDNVNLKARLNIATLHHRFGHVTDAITQYRIGLQNANAIPAKIHNHPPDNTDYLIELFTSNLAIAYLQVGSFAESRQLLEDSLHCVVSADFSCTGHDYHRTISTILHIQRKSLDFRNIEVSTHYLISDALADIARSGELRGSFTPFDSLLDDVPLDTRLVIARAASSSVLGSTAHLPISRPSCDALSKERPLRLGIISGDINEHPTAHLIEGLYDYVHRNPETAGKHVHIYTYSYGKNDESEIRQNIINYSHKFVDVSVAASHSFSTQLIAQDCIDVLLEMQLHTLNHRLEIVVPRPSVIQVNYLVFPGTSGASFLDTIIVDRIVAPPEHAKHYSEGLLLFPPTYQLSFFRRHLQQKSQHSVDQAALRLNLGLPTDANAILYCNMNKVDKVDQESLRVWLNVLVRVPQSYLWLLEPAKDVGKHFNATQQNGLVKENIAALASSRGIASNRIIYAPRVSKAAHIKRHAAADVFLDTLTYGAHSSATDALRGGLVILSVPSNSFPNRVVASLYASFCDHDLASTPARDLCKVMLPSTLRQFEESAVSLGRSKALIQTIRGQLAVAARAGHGIFHPNGGAATLLRGMAVLCDAKKISGTLGWPKTNVVLRTQ